MSHLSISFVERLTTYDFRSYERIEEGKLGVLHMDKKEPEKLKWMEDVAKAPQPLPNSLYNARFDFEGTFIVIVYNIMPYFVTIYL